MREKKCIGRGTHRTDKGDAICPLLKKNGGIIMLKIKDTAYIPRTTDVHLEL